MQLPSPHAIPPPKQNNMRADTYVRTVEHRISSISSKQHLRCSDALSQKRKVEHRSKAAERCSRSKTVPAACTHQQQPANQIGVYNYKAVTPEAVLASVLQLLVFPGTLLDESIVTTDYLVLFMSSEEQIILCKNTFE